MPYGYLTPKMEQILAPIVKDRSVWDFGCGDCERDVRMIELGAKRVTGIDKEGQRERLHHPKVRFINDNFRDLKSPTRIEVALVFWPCSYSLPWFATDAGLIKHLKKASRVVYLGSNVDGTACGYPKLFEYFLTRSVLHYEPNPKNSLIVYGRRHKQLEREVYGEERAGLRNRGDEKYMTFAQAEGRAPEEFDQEASYKVSSC